MAISSESGPRLLAPATLRSAWIVAGATLAVVSVALCCLFARESVGAYDVWVASATYNHCFLVLPVAFYLAWTRSDTLNGLSPRGEVKWLLALLPLSLLWLATSLISILELQQLVVMTMFQVIALSILGWAVYRAMLTPFLYLFFLVPVGYFLIPYLQEWTAAAAVFGLKLVGVPVYSDGMFIEVPSGNWVVAEACSGLRFLVASVAFAVLFASLVYRSRVRQAVFIALSIIVPIIANGLRAFGIIGLSELTDNATAVETDHLIYGWIFFTAVTLLLIVIGFRFADDGRRGAPRHTRAIPVAAPPWRMGVAGFIGLALAATGPAYAQLRDLRAPQAAMAQQFGTPFVKDWQPISDSFFNWRPLIEGSDHEYVGAFSDGSSRVLLYIAFYKETGFHNNLVRSQNDVADENVWRLVGNDSAMMAIGGKPTEIALSEMASPGGRLVIGHFYVVNGRLAATPMGAKLLQVRDLFGGGRVDAFVAVGAPERVGKADAERAIRAFLADLTLPGSGS